MFLGNVFLKKRKLLQTYIFVSQKNRHKVFGLKNLNYKRPPFFERRDGEFAILFYWLLNRSPYNYTLKFSFMATLVYPLQHSWNSLHYLSSNSIHSYFAVFFICICSTSVRPCVHFSIQAAQAAISHPARQ